MSLKKDNLILLAIIIVMFVLFSTCSTTFFKLSNIMTVLQRCVELGILSIGMTLCIMTGGINLSLAALCSINTVIIAWFTVKLGMPVAVGITVALAVSLLCGLLNGYLIAYLKVAPMLATLGTQAVFAGIGLVLTGGGAISGLPKSFTYLGNGKIGGFFPAQLTILIIAIVCMTYFMKYTASGRKVLLVGTNSTVATFSGINSEHVIMLAYALSSVMAFLAAVVISSRLASGRPDVADAFLMPAIAASIFGGASVSGGKGSIGGCMLGVLAFSILSNGLVQFLASSAAFYENVLMGLLLLGLLSSKMLNKELLLKLKTLIRVGRLQ